MTLASTFHSLLRRKRGSSFQLSQDFLGKSVRAFGRVFALAKFLLIMICMFILARFLRVPGSWLRAQGLTAWFNQRRLSCHICQQTMSETQIAKTICFHTHAVPAAYSLLLALVPEEPCMSTVADIISWVAWLEMIDPCVCERAWETLCHC